MKSLDGRISTLVTSVKITAEPIADYELPPPDSGNMYILLRLTVTQIVDIHLVDIMGFEEERPALQLADGQTYRVRYLQFTGIEYLDPTDITSPHEFIEGSEGVLAFEIPESGTRETLRLCYAYQRTWEEESPTRGEIEIDLQ